jgi:hypothetical protein
LGPHSSLLSTLDFAGIPLIEVFRVTSRSSICAV